MGLPALNPLPNWSPPQPASGPQNQNVIDYSAALGQALGCDPIHGCMTTPIQEPNSGDSLQSWVNKISQGIGGVPAAAATSAVSGAASAASGSCSWYDVPCQFSKAGFSWGRLIAIVLGLIFVGTGLIILAAQGVVGVAESKHARTITRAAELAA
jgi:hypothetical protein